MEQKLTEAFDALHMEDSCTQRIEDAMTHPRRSSARPVLRAAVAACLTLAILVIALNPTAARAVEEIAVKLKNYFSRTPGTIILEKDYTYYNDGRMEIDSQLGQTTVLSPTQFSPSWLRVMDDRVYYTEAEDLDIQEFLANKELYNITGQFSAEEPFIATFERDGITHYIAIGGDFDPEVGMDSIGCCEWLRRSDKMEEGLAGGDLHAGWIGGSSRIEYLDEEGTLFNLWMAKAIVELDIPWYYSEAEQQLESYETTE